jgi:hypothetical protein
VCARDQRSTLLGVPVELCAPFRRSLLCVEVRSHPFPEALSIFSGKSQRVLAIGSPPCESPMLRFISGCVQTVDSSMTPYFSVSRLPHHTSFRFPVTQGKIYLIGGVGAGAAAEQHARRARAESVASRAAAGGAILGMEDDSDAPGGTDNHRFNAVAVFDVGTATWELVKTHGDPPLPRSRHAAVAVAEYIFVHGGEGPSNVHTAAVGGDAGDSASPLEKQKEYNTLDVFDDLWCLDTRSMHWAKVDPNSIAAAAAETARVLASARSRLPGAGPSSVASQPAIGM